MYPNLEAEMVRNRISKNDMAKILKIRYATVHDKLKGKCKSGFTVDEALQIKKIFFKDLNVEYLFADSPISKSDPEEVGSQKGA